MPAAIPVPDQPGRLYIPATGEVVQQDSQYEGDIFDTVEFTTYAVGTKQTPFSTQTGASSNAKELHHTNLTQPKRLPSKAGLKLTRIGVHVRQWVGTARPNQEDVVALYELGNMRFLLGSTNLIAEGPLLSFPSGNGVTGISTAQNFSSLSLGVPSFAAAPRLQEQQSINDSMDLNCTIITASQAWLSTDSGQPSMVGNGTGTHILISVFLHGVIVKPLGA